MTDATTSRSWIWDVENSGSQIDNQVAVAKSLDGDPSFFEIDWAEWKLKPAALIVKILALSTGINPSHPCASMEWAGKYTKYVTGSAEEKLKLFQDRWPIVSNNLTKNGGDIEVIKPGGAWMDSIRLQDFFRLASNAGWDLPNRFPGNQADNTNDRQSDKDSYCITADAIPGITEKTKGITRLAYAVANRLEKESGKPAETEAVMAVLRKMAKEGSDPTGVLREVRADSMGVYWNANGNESKEWTLEACAAALKRLYKPH